MKSISDCGRLCGRSVHFGTVTGIVAAKDEAAKDVLPAGQREPHRGAGGVEAD